MQRSPCFNPRSRKGNDKTASRVQCDARVSIHVPARGTTRSSDSLHCGSSCFNPRSRKGNDRINAEIAELREMFQSTFPQGERRYETRIRVTIDDVSIHVPARGTTDQELMQSYL